MAKNIPETTGKKTRNKEIKFETKIVKIKEHSILKIPKEISGMIKDENNVMVTLNFKEEVNEDSYKEDLRKKMKMTSGIYSWFLERSAMNDNEKIVASPRTIANEFDIEIGEAVVFLSILESEKKVKKIDDPNMLIYKLV